MKTNSGAGDSQTMHSNGLLCGSQWTGSTRPEDGKQKERATTAGRTQPIAGKKFALESQNRCKETYIDLVIEYAYTLRGTSG